MDSATKNIILFTVPLTLMIAAVAFYIWALLDVNKKTGKNKTAWLIVIAVWPVVGAIIYCIFGRRRLVSKI